MKIYSSRYKSEFDLLDGYVGKDAWIKFRDLVHIGEYSWFRIVVSRDAYDDYEGNWLDDRKVDRTTGQYICTQEQFNKVTTNTFVLFTRLEKVVRPLEIRTTAELFNVVEHE